VPDVNSVIGVQALTDCTVAVIGYRDLDKLLSRPMLASALWRASMIEAVIYRERLSSMGGGTALERVAHLLFDRRPKLFLIGVELQRHLGHGKPAVLKTRTRLGRHPPTGVVGRFCNGDGCWNSGDRRNRKPSAAR